VVKTVIDEIKPVLDYSRQTILNMAASITISQLKTWLDKDGQVPRIFQVLPNVGIAERASMTFIAPDDDARDQLPQVNQIFEDLGQTMLTDEKMLVAGTALSGCAIAYAMRYVRAASEAAWNWDSMPHRPRNHPADPRRAVSCSRPPGSIPRQPSTW
jgi:pyrroline-5-carboxylate reductase